ncbi:hypothetical protein FSP39_008978 [Pinctada imbricata]|uniref:Uncharacterized protein n=1 Tax=Pinctada imbricata TaxID=66713 RepID=A0AA88YDK1_PINIB|nr:hypothetical protein FSP39_008978 [Pinctada imbricata]
MEMFGGDLSAYMACKTEFAHQSNWFPSPIAGLFSYLIWNGYDGFWQNGAILETITNFMYYANHTRYMNVIQDSYRELYSLLEAYGPYPSFDDMGCSQGWTYESGILVAAFAEMYKLHKNETYLMMADKLAWSTITYNSNGSDIFVEKNCEPDKCDDDMLMYKGIFARNIRYFLDVLPDQSKAEKYWKWINDNVLHMVKYNMCDDISISKCNITFKDGPPYYNISGPVFSGNWNGPFTVGAPMQQTSALDLFVSGIKPGTVCTGKYCDYSPYYPPPQPMTCGSHPCPTDQQCCEYSPYKSYTCCTPQQKCNKDGICV